MLSSSIGSPVPTAHIIGLPTPTATRSRRPANTDINFNVRTTFQTSGRTKGPAASKTGGRATSQDGGAILISETTYDVTSFFPKSTTTTRSASGGSTNLTTTTSQATSSSTSSSTATPNQSSADALESNKLSTILLVLLSIFGTILLLLVVGVYIARRRYKKRKAQKLLRNIQPGRTEADDNYHEEPHSPRGRQAIIAKRLSNLFFTPTSQDTTESDSLRRKRELYYPAKVTQKSSSPFCPPGDRIRMGDIPSSQNRHSAEPVDPGPSSPNPYMEWNRVDQVRSPPPHQTATTLGSLLNYYQNSGKDANGHGYERVPSGSHTPGQPQYETAYQDAIDQERARELERYHARLYHRADGFEPVTTYGRGQLGEDTPSTPTTHPRYYTRKRGSDSPECSTPRPMPTVSRGQHPVEISDTTSESSHNPTVEALRQQFGSADDTETESVAGIIRPVAESPREPAFQARLDALAKLDSARDHRNGRRRMVLRDERGEVSPQGPLFPRVGGYGGLEEGESSRETDRWHDRSTSEFSTSELQPSPLFVRKVSSTLPSSPPSTPPRPYKRTGYEEYMENPYGVGVRSGNESQETEESSPLHVRGSYENWVREQRKERMQRAANHRYNLSDTDSINYTIGEASGTHARHPLRPLAELTEDDFNPAIAAKRQAQAEGREYDDEGTVVQTRGRRSEDTHHPASNAWYHQLRERLRSPSPDSNRLSQIHLGTGPSEDEVGKGKGVVGEDSDDGYEYASTTVSDDFFLPRVRDIRAGKIPDVPPVPAIPTSAAPTTTTTRLDIEKPRRPPIMTEDTGPGVTRDMAATPTSDKNSKSKLRKKTSAGWKRLSGRFRKKAK